MEDTGLSEEPHNLPKMPLLWLCPENHIFKRVQIQLFALKIAACEYTMFHSYKNSNKSQIHYVISDIPASSFVNLKRSKE